MPPTDDRPDPDQLLARVETEAARARRGRLKVFFGACPGVGKTFSMLLSAQRMRQEGVDVVVGWVETHGRAETAALVAGLERLPAKRVVHRDRELEEFDLDAALARHPVVLLVDELAHTNAPGSRHPKRWQDIEELLDAGIDVHTSLNVQHLESLNDIVGSITGVRVWETVPDRIFDSADEVVLVDLPADDLLQRLKEGKVYVPEQAARAIDSFFRKGNLLALRELALRRTAERVDDEMRSYRRDYVGGGVWQAEEAVLACVGPNEGAEKVVRTAARLAAALNSRWHAIYVETPRLARLPEVRRDAILRTLSLAEELGAVTATLASLDPAKAAIDYARKNNLGKIVIGRHIQAGGPWFGRARPFVQQVANSAPDLDVVAIANERRPTIAVQPTRAPQRAVPWSRFGWALGICVLVSAISGAIFPRIDQTNIVMLYLLGIVVAAVRLGRGPAALAAVASVLFFDFFFVPPFWSFAVSDFQYIVTFAVMLIIGLLVAELMTRLQYQARVAAYREERAANLFGLARDLSGALVADQIAESTERAVGASFRAQIQLLVRDEHDALVPAGPGKAQFDPAIAKLALDRAEPAGLGTDTLPATPQLYMPLRAPMRTRGVLVLLPENPRLLNTPEQRRLLQTYAALIAMALERVHYVTVAQSTLVNMESERLRNSLLAAISHDLRTPLTSLVGLSETLAMRLADSAPTAAMQAETIRDQARRMASLVENLLEMARLQGGQVRLNRDWQSIEELVGTAIDAAQSSLHGRAVQIDLPRDLPLVRCDAVLIERVLVNLLENAAKYTQSGAQIGISVRAVDEMLVTSVWDEGPGVPRGLEQAIFEKFQRGERESSIPGVGLGLAIARAIVEAHRGRIRVEHRQPHGAAFEFSLPLEPLPKLPAESAVDLSAGSSAESPS